MLRGWSLACVLWLLACGEAPQGGMPAADAPDAASLLEHAMTGAAGAGPQQALPEAVAPLGPTLVLRRVVHVGDRLRLTFDAPITAVGLHPEDFLLEIDGEPVVITRVEAKGDDPFVLELEVEGGPWQPIGRASFEQATLGYDGPAPFVIDGDEAPLVGRLPVEPGKHLFLLLGQSNMAGRGDLAEAPSAALERADLLALGDEWVPASHPLNRYSSVGKDPAIQEVGPGYAFARAVQRELDAGVGLIVNARGGPGISAWQPDASDGLLDAAIERAILAERSGVLRGVLWHHGESDRAQAESYPAQVATMLQGLREGLEQPELHFVAGQLGTWPDKDNAAINAAIARIPDEVPGTSHVSGDGLERIRTGSSHFSAAGQQLLGERYAQRVLWHVYGIDVGTAH